MYQAAAALKEFFSGFGLPAYAENSVPDDVKLPYITFSIPSPEWNLQASMYAQVWDRTTSNLKIIQVADRIAAEIGDQGKRIPFPGGYLVIRPENPLIQVQTQGDARYAYLNLSINSYNLPGV